ncbi:MAG: RhuM family protein [Desulfobacterales bacterium]|nr:RhuM family protein [Desulfobacterales bacterium]
MICNSTAEFLIFTGQAGEQSIEARYEDETIWLSQKLMATLFDVDVRTVSEHMKNIFQSGELQEDSVIRKFRNTAADGKSYLTQFYNLDAIISVGYRINSVRATQFRQWATPGWARAFIHYKSHLCSLNSQWHKRCVFHGLGGKQQACLYIFLSQPVIFLHNFCYSCAMSQQAKNVFNRKPRPFDHWLAYHNFRIKSYAIK